MNHSDFTNAASDFQGTAEGLHSIAPSVIQYAKAAFAKTPTGTESQEQIAAMELRQLEKSIDHLMMYYDRMGEALGFPPRYSKS